MTLEVDAPRPPDLTMNVPDAEEGDRPESEHRAEIEGMLENAAWPRAFGEWSEHTDLTEADWAIVLDLELIEQFDFYWNADDEQIRYESPTIPEDWEDRDIHPDLRTYVQVSAINDSLDALGQTVTDLLQQEYVDWNTVEPSDEPE